MRATRPQQLLAAQGEVVIADTDGNALADHFGPILLPAPAEEPHPVPHPGCMACDPAIVASRRAHEMGVRTRPRGTPNTWRMVTLEPGGPVLFVPPGSEP